MRLHNGTALVARPFDLKLGATFDALAKVNAVSYGRLLPEVLEGVPFVVPVRPNAFLSSETVPVKTHAL